MVKIHEQPHMSPDRVGTSPSFDQLDVHPGVFFDADGAPLPYDDHEAWQTQRVLGIMGVGTV